MIELITMHLLIAFIYFMIMARLKRNVIKALLEAVFVACIPGFGLLFMLLLNIMPKPSKDPSYMYEEFTDDRVLLREFNLQESDILPVHDVLLLDDSKAKRTLLLDAIKRNVLENDQLLFQVTRDHDREVSHYAVSLLTSRIQNLENDAYQLEKQLEQTPEDIVILKQYAGVVCKYLKMDFLDHVSQKKWQQMYADILGQIVTIDPTEKQYFCAKIECELTLQHFEQAEQYCRLFLQQFNHDEAPYLQYVKLYYRLKRRQELKQCIRHLKASNIQLSYEALQVIRFWDRNDDTVRLDSYA